MTRPDEVPSWFWSTTRHPRLTLWLGGEPGAVLAELAGRLRARRFRIRERTEGGFRATHLDWWGLAGNPFEWDRTILEIAVRPQSGGSQLRLRVAGGRYSPAGRRRTVRALRDTVEAARGRGWEVTWGEWVDEDDPAGPDLPPRADP